jgi:5,10-methylenetetrahydromethanopterin reductase
MKFSYAMLPDYPLEESLRAIQLADELGFHAVYAADETWHKDLWLLFAAAAASTSRIRMGPSVSSIALREPTLIAQAAATLDELTGGRAEVVLSSGNFGLLHQYGIDWKKMKPLSRTIEGVKVIRTLLDDGAITFDGELLPLRRAVHLRPAGAGADAGEDGRDARAEVVRGVRRALRRLPPRAQLHPRGLRLRRQAPADRGRAGRQGLDAARLRRLGGARGRTRLGGGQGRRPQHGGHLRLLDAGRAARAQRGGPGQPDPIIAAIGAGDLARGIELTTPEIAEKLSFAGTPEEVTAKIKEIQPSGVNHLIAAITDASLVKAFTGRELAGVATVDEQLRLLHDEVMPAFA